MKKSILNRFNVSNWQTLDFTYKLIEFDLKPRKGEEAEFTKQMLLIAQKVASDSQGVAVPFKRDGPTCLLYQPTRLTLDRGPLK